MRKANKKGFTIVELVIVIAVIAILVAALIPTFSGVIEKANKSSDLQAARNSFTNYYANLEGKNMESLDKSIFVFKGANNYSYVIAKGAVETTAYNSKEEAETHALTETEAAPTGFKYNASFETVPGIDGLEILKLETVAQ